MPAIAGVVCGICGERLATGRDVSPSDGIARCGECLRLEPMFARAAAYGSYEGGLRELIHLLKYEQVRPAANVLGRMLGEAILTLVPAFGELPPMLIPVPLHASKLRQRGFNQSELIARAALKSATALRAKSLSVHTSLLERIRNTDSQTGLTRYQRLRNIRGAFAVPRPDAIAGRDILLVDDVFTTGTTISECARVLRRAGATRVLAATVARVLRSEPAFATTPPASNREEEAETPLRAMAARV
jgi:ComF family protein